VLTQGYQSSLDDFHPVAIPLYGSDAEVTHGFFLFETFFVTVLFTPIIVPSNFGALNALTLKGRLRKRLTHTAKAYIFATFRFRNFTAEEGRVRTVVEKEILFSSPHIPAQPLRSHQQGPRFTSFHQVLWFQFLAFRVTPKRAV
jgi:hypothetical protein